MLLPIVYTTLHMDAANNHLLASMNMQREEDDLQRQRGQSESYLAPRWCRKKSLEKIIVFTFWLKSLEENKLMLLRVLLYIGV